MYLIFDCENSYVGSVLRSAVENTTIERVLSEGGFYLKEVELEEEEK